MTNHDLARSHVRQAREILGEAQRHHANRTWHLVVRRSQEAVELALKGMLRDAGIEIPRVHDVGAFLRVHTERLPPVLRAALDRLVAISRRLRLERELSFYGDETVGTPPEQLYTAEDAEAALRDAGFVVALCEDALPAPSGTE